MVSGSRVLRADVVKASTTLSPTLSKRSFDLLSQRMDVEVRKRTIIDASSGGEALLSIPWRVNNETALARRSHPLSFDSVPTVGILDSETYTCEGSDVPVFASTLLTRRPRRPQQRPGLVGL